jgi:histidinol-phosphate aminotransferase
MANKINRRTWFKSGMAIGLGLSLQGAAAHNLFIPSEAEGAGNSLLGNEDTKFVKLNANENPYGPSPMARDAIIESMTKGNLYPRPFQKELMAAIAEKEDLSPDHILLSAGSTEILGICGLYFGMKGGSFVATEPTFMSFPLHAQQSGSTWVKVPMTKEMKIDLDAMAAKVNRETKVVYLCNPNNPVGTSHPGAKIRAFIDEVSPKAPILVDEAYVDFMEGGRINTVAPLVKNNKNLIVARTFSKIHGLAGMRIGYALAHQDTIKAIKREMTSRGMSTSACSLAAAHASMKDTEFLDYTLQQNNKAKEMIYPKLDEWGCTYAKSDTSFVIFNHPSFDKLNFRGELEKRNVLIRSFKFYNKNWCRVSIGKPEEIEVFLKEMQAIL